MMRLKDRQKSVPNGLTFYLPPLKWKSVDHVGRFPSFAVLCNAVERVVRANRALAAKHQWPADRGGIENWVDAYNAAVCARMGWDGYIMSDQGASVPKALSPHRSQLLASLKNAAAASRELVRGAKTLVEWEESGEPPVPVEKATQRAIVCAACPLNGTGDFTQWFTVPAAELIRRRIAKAHDRGLTTPRDDALNLCLACHCPLKLKVHVPLPWIRKVLSLEQMEKLKHGKDCWILAEMQAAES